MGRRGPSPTPTAILRLHNSILVPRRTGEPKGEPVSSLPCPEHLSAEAKKVWRELAPDLCQLKVLTKRDKRALARYCATFVNWKSAQRILDTLGDDVQLESSPLVKNISTWHQMLLRLEQEFGLTPSARARINVDHAAGNVDGDKLAEFIARKHG